MRCINSVYGWLSVALAVLVVTVASAQTSCANGTSLRKNIRTLPAAELKRYTDAVIALRNKSGSNGLSVYERFAEVHSQQNAQAHRGAYFLPWHRQMLYEFEVELNTVASPGPRISIPFWDAYAFSTDFTQDPTWQRMGGAASSQPIPDAPFANWRSRIGSAHDVIRGFTVGQSTGATFQRPEYIRSLVRQINQTFAAFAGNVEEIHDLPHSQICGDMCSTGTSPNDPIFYSHHAYIDMIWQRWQAAGAGNTFGGVDRSGAPATLETIMDPFGRSVSNILTGISTCVRYESSGGSVREATARTERLAYESPVQQATVASGPIRCEHKAKLAGGLKAAKIKVEDPASARKQTLESANTEKYNIDALRLFGFADSRINIFRTSFKELEMFRGVDVSDATVAMMKSGATLAAIQAFGRKELATLQSSENMTTTGNSTR
jgi:Common central domain of tyrosinase